MLRIPPVIALAILPVAVAAVSAAPASPVSLDRDPKLRKPIDVAARAVPLYDLGGRLSRETGLRIEFSRDTRDERVTLFARDRPVHELMGLVAEHFDYTWERPARAGSPDYLLVQTDAQKRREASRRGGPERDFAALVKQLEEQLALTNGPRAQTLARLSLEERSERLRTLSERLYGRPRAVREGDGTRFDYIRSGPPLTPREKEALQQESRLLALLTPQRQSRFNAFYVIPPLFAALAPEQKEALRQGETLAFAFPTEPTRVPLSAAAAAAVGMPGLGSISSRDDPETGVPQPIPCREIRRVRAELSLHRRGVETRLKVRVRALGDLGSDGAEKPYERVFTDELSSRQSHRLPPEARLDERSAALREVVTLAAPVPPEPDPHTSFEEALAQLSARIPYPVVADGYWKGELAGYLTAERRPLAEVLKRVCRIFDRRCRFARGTLWLRHPDWATLRARQPPPRLQARWDATFRRAGALTFSELQEVAGLLTPEQSEVLLYSWRGKISEGQYWMLERDLVDSGPVLRSLHRLPPPLRAALDEGRPVSLTALPGLMAALRPGLISAQTRPTAEELRQPFPRKQPEPGSGFELEDRLDAALARGELRLRREPATWIFGDHRAYLPDAEKEALEELRQSNPRATLKDLQRVTGELVTVEILVPGFRPDVHYFLGSVRER